MNGFNHSKDFLYNLCDKFPNAIRAVQEHWLAPPYIKQQGLNRLRLLRSDFDGFGNSAMSKDVSTKIRTGRPFGGTGFLYHNKYSSCLKPLVKYKHGRVSALELNANDRNIILINGYLPFYNTRDLQNQRILYQDTLAFMEVIMDDNPSSEFIFLLDMNCNIYNTNHMSFLNCLEI